ncbi:MAG: NUDIX hydrolase YfcD [Candidatus Electrothrix aestuarii]|uniref:NUDIX hydrolase YfcD n=1 Tax=Candidatus Electrothrix aestuarii TaxID=3062594 RepID=A0AAU8LVP8_9BACT|nr:NUDIX hydrolase YfcD [Candidatus Electrothrix aestuarii]WPD24937.1 MAG: NUDIX hydrolase YfcD [Candidatus Electrothrix sp. GW3-3]
MYTPGEEIVQIVDEHNRELGELPRRLMREQRLIHRASYILVFNAAGELFIQKRTMTKDVYPGYWDVAAGGVVQSGESYEQSAERELAEELGVGAVKMDFLFDQYYEDQENRVWGRIFTCTHEGPFTLQEEEVEYGRFMLPRAALELSRSEPFTPDGIVILEKLF